MDQFRHGCSSCKERRCCLGLGTRCGLSVDQDLNHLREREYMTLVRVLIAQDRLDEAVKWLANLLQLAGRRTHGKCD